MGEVIKTKAAVLSKRAPKPGGCYSQAIQYGDLLFVSGIVPADPKADKFTILYEGDIEKQTRLVLDHLKAIVEDAGSSLDNVLKTTVFIADMDDFHKFNDIYAEYFTVNPPARSTIQVGKFNWGITVEIEAIVAIPGR